MIGEFIEPRQELAGISRHYRETILPELSEMEAERAKMHGRAIWVAPLMGALGMVASVAVFITTGAHQILFWGLALSAFLGFAIYTMLMSKVKKRTKNLLVGEVAKFLGWEYSAFANSPLGFAQFLQYKLLPRHSRASFEDLIRGTAHGADFEMTEVHLETKGKNSYHTVFRGFVLSIDFHQTFTSTTVVLRDAGFFNRKQFKGMKSVGMASPKWEKLFEAYSTDQVEARVKLDPAFMEQLMHLEDSVDGKKLRFGFFHAKLQIVVETPNRFEAGSMSKPLTDPARMQKLIDEVDAIFAVIEAVQKRGREG